MHTEERAWRIGADGEEAVGRRLHKLPDSWGVIHSILVAEQVDVDHLVIGPGGVFTLNTKNHANSNVWVGKRAVMVNGQRTDYLRKSKYEATRVARTLSNTCGGPVHVEPVLVFIAEKLTVKESPEGVHVATQKNVARWLAARPPVLSTDAVHAIFEWARRSTTWTPAD